MGWGSKCKVKNGTFTKEMSELVLPKTRHAEVRLYWSSTPVLLTVRSTFNRLLLLPLTVSRLSIFGWYLIRRATVNMAAGRIPLSSVIALVLACLVPRGFAFCICGAVCDLVRTGGIGYCQADSVTCASNVSPPNCGDSRSPTSSSFSTDSPSFPISKTTLSPTDSSGPVPTDSSSPTILTLSPTPTTQPTRMPTLTPSTAVPSSLPTLQPTTSLPSRAPTTNTPTQGPTSREGPVTASPLPSPPSETNPEDAFFTEVLNRGLVPDFGCTENNADAGLVCDYVVDGGRGRVTAFDFSKRSLAGSVPNFANLTYLTSVRLSGNQLSGAPPSIACSAFLKEVWLDDNLLTGSLDEWLPRSDDLCEDIETLPLLELHISNNQLTGAATCTLHIAHFFFQLPVCLCRIGFNRSSLLLLLFSIALFPQLPNFRLCCRFTLGLPMDLYSRTPNLKAFVAERNRFTEAIDDLTIPTSLETL